jgi:hypothetical protein
VVNRKTLRPLFRDGILHDDAAQRLPDIADNIDAIAEFTAHVDFAAFVGPRSRA